MSPKRAPDDAESRHAATLLADIDRARERLKRMLRGRDATALATRPANGDWSVVENVRHLLFAEQLHLGPLMPGKIAWSPAGLAYSNAKRFAGIGTNAPDDVAVAMRAWDDVHRPIRRALRERAGADVRKALARNLRHLNAHIAVIERLLRP